MIMKNGNIFCELDELSEERLKMNIHCDNCGWFGDCIDTEFISYSTDGDRLCPKCGRFVDLIFLLSGGIIDVG